jgi:hypothetical protein
MAFIVEDNTVNNFGVLYINIYIYIYINLFYSLNRQYAITCTKDNQT